VIQKVRVPPSAKNSTRRTMSKRKIVATIVNGIQIAGTLLLMILAGGIVLYGGAWLLGYILSLLK